MELIHLASLHPIFPQHKLDVVTLYDKIAMYNNMSEISRNYVILCYDAFR